MKANELMIDDWVYRPDCYDQVKELEQELKELKKELGKLKK